MTTNVTHWLLADVLNLLCGHEVFFIATPSLFVCYRTWDGVGGLMTYAHKIGANKEVFFGIDR